MNYNGTEYFYVTNLQGDVIELLDSQGTRVVSYEYDAWGNILYQTGGVLAELNPYRYRGYRYDSETDYYYLQSRYYDPSIGRFISSDGLVGEVGNLLSHNMYAYGANNPVMNVDPSGYAPEWLEDYWEWVLDGYTAVYEELQREFVLDISFTIDNVKIGISVIVNLEDEYIEFYPHVGGTLSLTSGPSLSFGVVDNYDQPGDYGGPFVYFEGELYIGGGHCFTPFDYSDGARAYYISLGSPNASIGIDYYLWSEWMVYDWSN